MSEIVDPTKRGKKDLGLEKMQPYLEKGEVLIGNWADGSEPFLMDEGERPGWKAAQDINNMGEKAKWKNVRVVDAAFDRDGNKLEHS